MRKSIHFLDIEFNDNNILSSLFGVNDVNIHTLEKINNVKIEYRGNKVKILGSKKSIAATKNELINEVFKKHNSKDIFVVGFSQGALICYEFICKLNKPLGGIFPIAGFLRSNSLIINPRQNKTPIIIGHGTYDQIISIEQSQKAYKLLKKQNSNTELITYKSSHRIPTEMLKIIAEKIDK